MKIDFKVLKKLLDCNKNLKLKMIEENNNLEILINNNIISNLKLNTSSIEDNADIIYYHIINLENTTLYIPKIYIKE